VAAQLARRLRVSSERAAGFGGKDRQPQSRVACKLHHLITELELADDGVPQALGPGLVVADVVRGPPGAERLAADRQLTDEIGQRAVMGVAAGHRAQGGDEVLCRLLPIDEDSCAAWSRKVKRALFGTDWIDLYQVHRPDLETDVEETLSALTDLVQQGKVRYIGSSSYSAGEIDTSYGEQVLKPHLRRR
jgi:hypothetical protein